MSDVNATSGPNPIVKTFPASPSTLAADASKVANDIKEDEGGIVAIGAASHAEAKSVFALLKDKVAQGVADVEAEFSKLETLLGLKK